MRPEGLPDVTSRRVRSCVARGSMAYSAVTQPWPEPRSQGGPRSSSEAVHRTLGVAEGDEAGALGIARDATLERDLAQLVGGAFRGPHHALRKGGALIEGRAGGSKTGLPG